MPIDHDAAPPGDASQKPPQVHEGLIQLLKHFVFQKMNTILSPKSRLVKSYLYDSAIVQEMQRLLKELLLASAGRVVVE